MNKKLGSVIVIVLAGLLAATVLILHGCQVNNRPTGTSSLLGGSPSEKWTIRCCRIESPNHAQEADSLVAMLKRVQRLDPRKIRVVADATGSTIYYGEYRRVESRATGQLVFPPEFQKEIEFIRSLSAPGVGTPFFSAQPELVDAAPPSAHPEWDAVNAKATHSLRIAMFYNTPTFTERKQAAEQYVEILRKDGFAAYYQHEPVKSYVYVGDFAESDIVRTPEGNRPSPRVEQLIARRADEFRNVTENGYLRRTIEAGGKGTAPLSEVVPLPRKADDLK